MMLMLNSIFVLAGPGRAFAMAKSSWYLNGIFGQYRAPWQTVPLGILQFVH